LSSLPAVELSSPNGLSPSPSVIPRLPESSTYFPWTNQDGPGPGFSAVGVPELDPICTDSGLFFRGGGTGGDIDGTAECNDFERETRKEAGTVGENVSSECAASASALRKLVTNAHIDEIIARTRFEEIIALTRCGEIITIHIRLDKCVVRERRSPW
jgi:hypothetical protein